MFLFFKNFLTKKMSGFLHLAALVEESMDSEL
jgi:hypothetical protein